MGIMNTIFGKDKVTQYDTMTPEQKKLMAGMVDQYSGFNPANGLASLSQNAGSMYASNPEFERNFESSIRRPLAQQYSAGLRGLQHSNERHSSARAGRELQALGNYNNRLAQMRGQMLAQDNQQAYNRQLQALGLYQQGQLGLLGQKSFENMAGHQKGGLDYLGQAANTGAAVATMFA